VLGLFDTLSDAFGVLMHGFWRDELHRLGGVPAETAERPRAELIKVLRRRLGKGNGALQFSNEEDINRLASEALRAGRKLARERVHVPYEKLRSRWAAAAENYIAANPKADDSDSDDHYRDERQLTRSLQLLCQREVLFQGREWRCRTCYNRNWISIDKLSRTMICEVCRRKEPAPVAGEWQFRANPFLIEAYRDHGTEALVWALWQLRDHSQHSFYYAPSLRLWLCYPKSTRGTADAEVDAIAIVDGRVHLVEAKSASSLNSRQITQLVTATERIRPDVVVVACMDEHTEALKRSVTALSASIPECVEVKVLTFSPEQLRCNPLLPSQ
jgi:hypothetical protein